MKSRTPGDVVAAAFIAACALVALLSGCTPEQQAGALATPAGQLFCSVHNAGGGTATVALADASVTASNPTALPLAIIATGATKAFVDAACAAAAPAGGSAVPVPPPGGPVVVPIVAVTPPPVVAP
jgi:hypothetical protein